MPEYYQQKADEVCQKIKETLKNWPLIVKKYQKPNIKKSTIQILNSFLPFVGIWYLMYLSLDYSYWLTLVLGIVNVGFLIRIFIIQHDCGHKSFFSSNFANDLWGVICSVFSFLPYDYWKRAHNYHHSHNGDLDFREMGDIPLLTVEEYKNKNWFDKICYRFIRSKISILFIAPVTYFLVNNRIGASNVTSWLKECKSLLLSNGFMFSVLLLIMYFIGWERFLLVQIPIWIPFFVVAFWVFYVQHQHEEGYKHWHENWEYLLAAVKGSSYYKLPKVLQWFTGNIGFHHIHHLSPVIPNYNLEKCNTENPILEKYAPILTLKSSFKCIFNKLWDEKQQKMITWKEYKKYYT